MLEEEAALAEHENAIANSAENLNATIVAKGKVRKQTNYLFGNYFPLSRLTNLNLFIFFSSIKT